MADRDTKPEGRWAMRDGLAWLDRESHQRSGRSFVEASGRQRAALLDEIAWPGRAKPEMQPGVIFFNSFRDLTASGFWSSEMGVKDLQYRGNAFVPEWRGCPEAALRKVGVRYEDRS
jgi:gluconate 2-dehydrogenase gamma chain